jgi:hypothetical protein
VAVSGNYAYVADRNGSLQVIDVSQPASTASGLRHQRLPSVRCGAFAYVAMY